MNAHSSTPTPFLPRKPHGGLVDGVPLPPIHIKLFYIQNFIKIAIKK